MSDTTFVVMYHPALGNVQVDAPLQAVSTYQSHGWLLLDPGATAPPVASPYLTQPAADSRYLRDWVGAEVLTAGAVRVAPDGHVIVRVADGTTRSTYDGTEAALWTALGGANDPALRAAYGLAVAATVTASGALVPGKHNPVDATSGTKAMTLPTGAVEGAGIGVEKLDTSTNAVTVTGNIRGASGQSISLPWAHETLVLRADSTGSWWPVAGHKTKASLDAAYAPLPAAGRNPLTGWFHVDGFGAIGDGTAHPLSERYGSLAAAQAVYPFVTALTQTIDWAAWQAAANAVPATGGVLYGCRPQYVNSDTVYVKSGTITQGAGKLGTQVKRQDNSFAAASTNNSVLRGSVFVVGPSFGAVYTDSSRGSTATFRDLGIDGNKANQTYTGITDFNYVSDRGIAARSVDHIEVTGCRISNTGMDGVFYAACGQTSTHHNDFINCGMTTGAIDSLNLSKNGVSHNGNLGTGLPYETAANCSDNYFLGTADEGIQYGWVRDVIISRNHIYNSRKKGIEGDSSSSGGGSTAPGSAIITDNVINTTGEQGIGVTNADYQRVTITGNQIIAAGWDGINFSQATESTLVVANNIIEGFGGSYSNAGGYQAYKGIGVAGHKVSIIGNKVYDGGGHGISVTQATTALMVGNTVRQVLGNGLNFNYGAASAAADVLTMNDNTVFRCDKDGFYVSINGTLGQFTFSGNTGYNIGTDAATGGSVDGLRITGSTTIIRDVVVNGNNITDRRGTVIMGFGINLNGVSTITRFSYSGNVLRPSLFEGVGGRSQVSTIFLNGGGNLVDTPGGVRTVTTNYTFLPNSNVVLSNGTNGGSALVHTLANPSSGAATGRRYTLRNIHATVAATLQVSNGALINGTTTVSVAAGSSITVVSDGTNYYSV